MYGQSLENAVYLVEEDRNIDKGYVITRNQHMVEKTAQETPLMAHVAILINVQVRFLFFSLRISIPPPQQCKSLSTGVSGGLYSFRRVTEVKLGRDKSKSRWVTSEA